MTTPRLRRSAQVAWRPVALALALTLGGAAPADELLGPAPVLDPANPDLPRLQKPVEALDALPRDKRGRVDWMQALRRGLIQPRADLQGRATMELLNLDIVMPRTAEMPHVKFPHEAHSQWLACSNCHDRIFVPKAGANPITMAKIFRGEYCGVCHDRVAFTTLVACERCHSVPHGGVKAWW